MEEVKKTEQLKGKSIASLIIEPKIRTMATDIASLKKDGGLSSELKVEPSVRSQLPISLKQETQINTAEPVKQAPLMEKPVEKPVAPERPEAPIKKEKKKTSFWPVLLVSFLIVTTVGIFIYWWTTIDEKDDFATHFECQNYQCITIEGDGIDQCLINQDCEVSEPTAPLPLVSVDAIWTIERSFDDIEPLIDTIKDELDGQQQATSTFMQILVKQSQPSKKEYISLETLVELLGINLYSGIMSRLADISIQGDEYSLLAYKQEEGVRLALVINLSKQTGLMNELKDWENTILADLKPLLLQDEVPVVATEEMVDANFLEVPIRYFNLPNQDLSLDYAIMNKKLIIATSKESTLALINLLDDFIIEDDEEENIE